MKKSYDIGRSVGKEVIVTSSAVGKVGLIFDV